MTGNCSNPVYLLIHFFSTDSNATYIVSYIPVATLLIFIFINIFLFWKCLTIRRRICPERPPECWNRDPQPSARAASTKLLGLSRRRQECTARKHRPFYFLTSALPHTNVHAQMDAPSLQHADLYCMPDTSREKATSLSQISEGGVRSRDFHLALWRNGRTGFNQLSDLERGPGVHMRIEFLLLKVV